VVLVAQVVVDHRLGDHGGPGVDHEEHVLVVGVGDLGLEHEHLGAGLGVLGADHDHHVELVRNVALAPQKAHG
jgi:hypothetical protein